MGRYIRPISLVFVVIILTLALALRSDQKEPLLLEYVHRDDGAFAWELVGEQVTPLGVTFYELKLTSQTWKGIVWTHTLLIAEPPSVTTSTAMLVISGGRIGSRGDTPTQLLMTTSAAQLQAIVAVLLTVPNQPLFDNLLEDDLIAYTLVKVLETNDPEWACLLPMAKSAVKAMDAVQQFAEQRLKVKIDGFVVTGASKRGWTTWLTAVADQKRVKGIAPMVYDNLNIPAQMKHQREVFGGYSEMISEYSSRGLTDLADTEKGKPITELIDPYFYRQNLTMPKLIINGTNDRYWTLDALNLYFHDLPGQNYILYVPNSGHGLQDIGRVVRTLSAFFNKIAGRINFPTIDWDWEKTDNGVKLTIYSNQQPKQVLLWTAQTQTKDFRDSIWSSQTLSPTDNAYIYTLTPPETGQVASFAELFYEEMEREYSLCTTIYIIAAEQQKATRQ